MLKDRESGGECESNNAEESSLEWIELEETIAQIDIYITAGDNIEVLIGMLEQNNDTNVEEQIGTVGLLLNIMQGMTIPVEKISQKLGKLGLKPPSVSTKHNTLNDFASLLRAAKGKQEKLISLLHRTEASIRKRLQEAQLSVAKKKEIKKQVEEEEQKKQEEQQLNNQAWRRYIQIFTQAATSNSQNGACTSALVGGIASVVQLFSIYCFSSQNMQLNRQVADFAAVTLETMEDQIQEITSEIGDVPPDAIFESPRNIKEFLKKTMQIEECTCKGNMCKDIILQFCGFDNVQIDMLDNGAKDFIDRFDNVQQIKTEFFSKVLDKAWERESNVCLKNMVDVHVDYCKQNLGLQTLNTFTTSNNLPQLLDMKLKIAAGIKVTDTMLKQVKKLEEKLPKADMEKRIKIVDIRESLYKCLEGLYDVNKRLDLRMTKNRKLFEKQELEHRIKKERDKRGKWDL